MPPYVSLATIKGVAVIVVTTGREPNEIKRAFTLDAAGCRAAGRWLHDNGHESWQNSSSVDHPADTLPTFRGDVHALMQEGFTAAIEVAAAPGRALARKMIAHCADAAFQAGLTDGERAAFERLRKENA